jgi:hypothetical protein
MTTPTLESYFNGTHNERQLIEFVEKKLLEQGKMSMGENGCRYRGDDGCKCGIGHLIPDELYLDEFDINDKVSTTVEDIIERYGEHLRVKPFIDDNPEVKRKIGFLTILQHAHDDLRWAEQGSSKENTKWTPLSIDNGIITAMQRLKKSYI